MQNSLKATKPGSWIQLFLDITPEQEKVINYINTTAPASVYPVGKLDMPQVTTDKAIRRLICKGLINVVHTGSGLHTCHYLRLTTSGKARLELINIYNN